MARQRDLRELVGENLAGSLQLQFSDVLRHWEARFHRITLEDRNLPAIAEKLLGEELLLPSIASWWCGEPPVLDEALDKPPAQT